MSLRILWYLKGRNRAQKGGTRSDFFLQWKMLAVQVRNKALKIEASGRSALKCIHTRLPLIT